MQSLTELLAAFLADGEHSVISITGAGGKTSTLTSLGRYFKAAGRSVLLTTTTKIQSPSIYDFHTDFAFTDEAEALMHEPVKGQSVFFAQKHIMDPKKTVAPRLEVLSVLVRRYDIVLIEADGARGLPLKYHTQRDPVILKETTATLAVMGATAFGETVDNVCFGFDSSAVVEDRFINFLISDSQGVLKGARGKTMVLINQADEKPVPIANISCPVPLVTGSVLRDEIYERRGI